jgi:hypothetical protein
MKKINDDIFNFIKKIRCGEFNINNKNKTNICKYIEKIYTYYKEVDIAKMNNQKYVKDYNDTMEDFYSSFVNKNLFVYENKINSLLLDNCTFIYPDSSSNDLCIKLICKRYSVFNKIFKKNNLNHLKIYIDPNERKRILPSKKINNIQQIDLDKKGNALTTAGLTNHGTNIIILTKKEEIYKLLLHELFHYYDIQPKSENIVKKYIKDKWFIENTLNVYESHCELLSIIFHCMFLACEAAIANTLNVSNENLYQLFIHYLNIERKYSLYLTSKILYFHGYNINNYKSFFNTTTKRDDITKIFNHSISAYTIIRGILFNYLYEYLYTLDDKFYPIKEYSNNVVNIIEKIYLDTKYFEYLEIFFLLLEKNKIRNTSLSVRYIAYDININIYKFIDQYIKIE